MTYLQRVSDGQNSEDMQPVAPESTTTDTSAAVLEIRALLTEDQNRQCPDDMVLRYWRATGHDTRHAAKRIQDTLAWWAKEQPSSMFCSACQRDPCSHYMQCVCRDVSGRPVIYSCLELANNKNIEDNRKHMISVFEAAISLMGPGVESWCWILDFHGFSIRDCDPRLARIFLHLAATHYPERLGHFWIIDAPALFSTLWSAVERFIDPKTRKKIAFLSLKKREKLTAVLAEHFDKETINWLIAEMSENRQKGASKGENAKFYEYAALRRLKNGEDGAADGAHYNLGSPAFLKELRNWSGALPPQLTLNAKPDEQQ